MARLIDADALIPKMESDANQMDDPIAIMFAYAAISDIKHAPTVEAIPIEWMKQKYPAAVNSDSTRYISKVDLLNEIIEEWRKEE